MTDDMADRTLRKGAKRMIAMGILGLAAFLLMAWSVSASREAEKAAPMLGTLIDANGVALHVLDAGPKNGAKPPVVLIHGASVNLRDMKIALGDALSADRRVVMIDRPGRGYSDRPPEGWRIDVQAAHIRSALEGLGVEKPIVVGQSFGGAVALAYALQHQDDMSGLVLLAPVSHVWPGGVAWYNNVSQIPVIGFLLRRLVIPAYGRLAAEDGVNGSFAPGAPPQDYAERAGLALLFRPKDFKSNAADLARLKPQIARQETRYGALDLPVVILTGEADTTVSPRIHSRALVEQIDGASLTMLPETGHALHHAQGSRIIEAIDALSARPSDGG